MCSSINVWVLGFSLFFTSVNGFTEDSQPTPTPQTTSGIQVINATSIPSVDFRITDLRDYPSLRQGSRISGGVFPRDLWDLSVAPAGSSDKKTIVRKSHQLQNGRSGTVILVGDFAISEESKSKDELRADILFSDNSLTSGQKPNRIVLVNGVSNQSIHWKINAAEQAPISAMAIQEVDGNPKQVTVTTVNGKQSLEIPLEFIPPISSIIIALFLKDGRLEYSVMPQASQ